MLKYASTFPNVSLKPTLFTCEHTELNTLGEVLHSELKTMPLETKCILAIRKEHRVM